MIDVFSDAWIVSALAGLVGLMIGSFLNVCTLRWPEDESVVFPGSHCPKCGEPIRWYDNVPVLGYVLLRGRCRACREPISLQYPLVELATGLVWAGMFSYAGLSFEALRGTLLLTILFGIALTDARFYIIPDQFSLGGLVLGLGLAFLPGGIDALDALIGAIVGFGLLGSVAVVGKWMLKKDAMGLGDIKMMAMVGAFLGWAGVLLTVFLGALLGAVIFGPISYKTKKLVPFGIFLAAAAAITYGFGSEIIDWYLTNILHLPPAA
ncbi:MAG: prepilin peptidase [Gemmatimonadota bacterium]|uniref:Prepilin type IV endopeptidase peptidase domain-containing protein n=1 Tax=marine metagenome TaxID=408172 RepID=A0A381Q7Y9_9ZZZZ|nr:prepilin peptidase [Gemmatimonadota bacterium]MEC9242502.1 prepilin peptidase [Gemmatimonadota bacterium]MEC9298093.1 prepilin peptidase [Gemmatimonadota bacterium]MED5199941.1 prepilin peptidase [Gemmatimonadota bacterium]MED5563624.1 prepilin peptidase [Gemmatimonadota bacterium]